jgi:hypothetical protein
VSAHLSFSSAMEEFDEAWNDPSHTPIAPSPVDVNALLQQHYSTSEPLRLTKPMLWDAETKKAWDPMTYIPGVVREGESWGRKPLENGEEFFLRASRQRAWRADADVQVVEEVYSSPKEQRVLFLGRAEPLPSEGQPREEVSHQPLFHVEHAVGGTDSAPLNLWRIVHLTAERDDDLIRQHTTQPEAADWLRKFIAIYVEKDLGIELTQQART